MSRQSLFHHHFYLWNFVGIAIAGLILRPYQLDLSLVEWPIGPLLSAYLLSSLLYSLHLNLRRWKVLIPTFLAFIGFHWLLSGIFVIVLTRFLRYPEVYTLGGFSVYLLDHRTSLLDASIWFLLYAGIFWGLSTRKQVGHLQQSIAELEKKLNESDLSMLSKEINPHFLFNAMNAIVMKVRLKETKDAVAMIAALNDLLRLSLSKQFNQLITLEEEQILLEKYLSLEKARFGDHVTWDVRIPDNLKKCKIPRLILQPLAENAFKHGLNSSSERLELKIDAVKEGEKKINIRVFNSKEEPRPINYASANVGLPNVVQRLKQFYQTDFQFRSFIESDGVAFQITIPTHYEN